MTTEEKELIGLLFNVLQLPTIGTELKEACESKLLDIIKSMSSIATIH